MLGLRGPWPVTETFMPDSVEEIDTDDHLTDELASTPLDNIGVRAGASVATTLRDRRSGLLRIDGSILGCVQRATPLDTAATEL